MIDMSALRTKVYLRVAKSPNAKAGGVTVAASTKPNQKPLTDTRGHILPTVMFALELEIPRAAFRSAARVVAALRVPEERLEIAAEVVELDESETP